ncbi:MAG: succinate dehydrogenase, hydrophobic membrane anchor protein [Pseudomonadota bacterium]
MSFKTDYSRVAGLGSAKEGVKHWWEMKLTSIALIPLSIFALAPLSGMIGSGDAAVVAEVYAAPWNAVMMILFLAVTFRHLQQGIQVVIEDYVHDARWRTLSLVLNSLFCAFVGMSGVFAVLKIAFSG